jgi:acetyltransferase
MNEQHYLTSLFEPSTVAIFGATERPDAVGNVVFHNILDSHFKGRLFAVNPKYSEVHGQPCFKAVNDIGARVDLAIIATRPQTVPAIIEQCGQAGVRNAIVLASGFSESGHVGAAIERKMVEMARSYNVRILGPNCLGIMRPILGLNATFSRATSHNGNMAFVSQSGAMCVAALDWASANGIGFSSVVSVGTAVDVDIGEILDYLIYDNRTQYILLYIEGIRNARRFMSAIRSASRIKPIIMLKAGRHAGGERAVKSHSGMSAVPDAVFDAAVRRAGVVRVKNVGQMFFAAKAMSHRYRPQGTRIAIVTNGGGPGALAADRAGDLCIPLAELSAETIQALNACLPLNWSHNNPIDIMGDATPERYRDALMALSTDPGIDAIMVILTPAAMTRPDDVAQMIIDIHTKIGKPVSCCWLGETLVANARGLLEAARIPVYRTPEHAIDLHANIATYYHNQKLLIQTPDPRAERAQPQSEGARMLIEAVLAEKRKLLSEMESKAVLRAFKVPVAQTMVARSTTEAILLAEQMGFPVALKVDSPDLTQKTDAGGVRLNINSAAAVRNAYADIIETVQKRHPNAHINGISIEPFLTRPNGRELMIGVVRDRTFGPVLMFGAGGNDVEVFLDRAIALPPLNDYLAEDLINSTKVANVLGQFHNMPPVNMQALVDVLLRISEMVCELPWIQSLDLNPLIIDDEGAIAADARIVIDHTAPSTDRYAHMAIHPYPVHLVQHWTLADDVRVLVRPIRPEDADMVQEFVRSMSDESRYFRFMDTIRELSPSMLTRFTQIDYDREMALVATIEGENGREVEIGVARYVSNPDGDTVEFALAVGDDWQKHGVGPRLMATIIECAQNKGYRAIIGDVLASNDKMLKLMTNLGFSIHPHPEDAAVKRVVKPLHN